MSKNDPNRSLLTRDKILEHMDLGDILINPYNKDNLKTTSYDVRIGPYFFREHSFRGSKKIFNPLDQYHVLRYWGEPQSAVLAKKWFRENGKLENISNDDYLIIIEPQETILAHTIEFIGGRNCVTTEMRARSSMGRIGLTICKCAGWGDLGYINRWTMEITNHLNEAVLVLPVGIRVAQIIFYKVDPIKHGSYASECGKYQTTDDLEELIGRWNPSGMLPQLYKDSDIGHFHKYFK